MGGSEIRIRGREINAVHHCDLWWEKVIQVPPPGYDTDPVNPVAHSRFNLGHRNMGKSIDRCVLMISGKLKVQSSYYTLQPRGGATDPQAPEVGPGFSVLGAVWYTKLRKGPYSISMEPRDPPSASHLPVSSPDKM